MKAFRAVFLSQTHGRVQVVDLDSPMCPRCELGLSSRSVTPGAVFFCGKPTCFLEAVAQQHFYLGIDGAEVICGPAGYSFVYFRGEPQGECFAGDVGDASVYHGGGSFEWWDVGARTVSCREFRC